MMPNNTVSEQLANAIRTVDSAYYRLVLLVGKSGVGKTRELQNFAADCHSPIINVNLLLAEKLLELTVRQRILRLPDLLRQITENSPAPVILDNLEILFDAALQQDPLKLLQTLSRNHAVIAAWNGRYETAEKRLYYAEYGHPEYKVYDSPDAQIISF